MAKFLLKLFNGHNHCSGDVSLCQPFWFSGNTCTWHMISWFQWFIFPTPPFNLKMGGTFYKLVFSILIWCHSRDMSAPPLISNTTMALFYIVVHNNTYVHKMSIFYYIKYKIVNYKIQFDSMKKFFFPFLLFGGFPRPSVSDAVVPVRPELLLHSLTVITQVGILYNNMIKHVSNSRKVLHVTVS